VNVEDLRSMTEEELIRSHDTEMQNRAAHYNIYLDELRRRESERQGERMEALTCSMVSQGERMEKLTRSINILTIIVVIATLIGVALTAWSVLFSG
jgi:hypothetical protein